MHRLILPALAAALLLLFTGGCDDGAADTQAADAVELQDQDAPVEREHAHTDDDDHAHDHDHDHAHADHDHAHDHGHSHEHEEVPLGTTVIDGMEVELAQSHGFVEPGKICHIVVKLPDSDNGATIVRAWIGTENRFESIVGKGEYAASHDDYDIHVEAPDPLPADARWWIEIERPDGATAVGSAPILTAADA